MTSNPNPFSYNDHSGDEHEDMEQTSDSTLDSFLTSHSGLGVAPSPLRLRSPVVIPQRRPGNKERGFVEAYAPDLQAFGIDQETFLALIRSINKAAQASKWLYAIQVAAIGTGFIPNHIALGVSTAVQIVAGIVAKTETRWKTNSFMDRANISFFQPRGLYCLLMSYNPISTSNKEKTDPVQAMLKHKSTAGASSKTRRNLRNPSAGVSHGQDDLPDSVATLVYPTIERTTQNSYKKKAVFAKLNNYFDQRAQARYASESNGDILSTTPQKPFSNRFLDPNHPVSNGGLLGLLSGGKLTPDLQKQKESMRSAMADQEQLIRDQQSAQMANLISMLQGMDLTAEEQQAYIQQYESAYEIQLQQLQDQSELLENGQRRINRNILYLMIVNLPSPEEMEAAQNGRSVTDLGNNGNGVTIASVDVE
ncbi:hypothetical protein FVEG_12583 [Fusarium verticillioides 7600]|uniref:Uncharacterized protein n=1 Tax=Gibberella moniliformis (strain M3125 / FGSC 7600) TaxID=334819 RepID=W7MS83_GIBM7|nr:hypothetical protein FVEG_12583 [Fusarium verticillioides 7600]EWG54343.1 hypothetical protein FVEG_12583 [Fusarium verticillioides 7600]